MKEQDLERRLLNLKNIHREGSFSWNALMKRTGLRRLDRERPVFTDGELVYKFRFCDKEVDALKRMRGIENVQQLVAYTDDILVTELIPAKPVKKGINPPRNHLERLLETLLKLRDRRVCFSDIYPGNLLYSQELGFFPIDLSTFDLRPYKNVKPEIKIPILASCMTDSTGTKFLDIYLTLLDIFYDLNPRLAKSFLKQYIYPSYAPQFFGRKADQSDLEKIKTVLEKYNLLNDKFNPGYYSVNGRFGLVRKK